MILVVSNILLVLRLAVVQLIHMWKVNALLLTRFQLSETYPNTTQILEYHFEAVVDIVYTTGGECTIYLSDRLCIATWVHRDIVSRINASMGWNRQSPKLWHIALQLLIPLV